MYYEIYIDQFFLEHLLIGFCLIQSAAVLLKRRCRMMRLLAAAVWNALLMTLLVCLGRNRLWYLAAVSGSGMIAFGAEGKRETFLGTVFLLLLTVCFGGVLEGLTELFGMPVPVGAAAASGLLVLAGRRLERQQKMNHLIRVRLCEKDRTETVQALLDTGNQLTEPLTHRPVSIVEESCLRRLLEEGWEKEKGFLLIPYHSIGRKRGWLQGVRVDRMYLEEPAGETRIERPVLAVYRGKISAGGRYQMILNPLHTAFWKGSMKQEEKV